MILAIDIGNTNITFGIFKGNKIIKRFGIPTKDFSGSRLKSNLKALALDGAVICSVVPQITRVLAGELKGILARPPYIIGKDIRVPIKNRYRKPGQVGQDRLVNAYAGTRLYGAPLIVVDFGTAITFDVISRRLEYLGGFILAGLQISLDALAKRTALLPGIKLSRPREFIGRDTKSSMLSGVVYGSSCMTDGLITKIRKKTGKGARVIGTGGNIGLMAKYCKQIDRIDEDLTLKGLDLIYNEELL